MILRLSGAEVDLQRRVARRDGAASVELHPREVDLLAWLVAHPVRPVDRRTLLREIWGYRGSAHTRVVDVTVRRLREKIEREPSAPDHVLTVRGVGYRFEPPSARQVLPDALIGRDAVLAEIRTAVAANAVITVYGLPGIGKSAVLDAVARELHDAVRVDGSTAVDGDELAARMDGADAPGRVLLVDHVDACASSLARSVPALRARAVVVAARAPLGVPGERTIRLGPLSAPDAEALYRHRAGPHAGPFALAICESVGHLPLAVVLAAAQRPDIAEETLLARARDLPLALEAELGALPERHRHLGRALALGFDGIEPWERRALAQLTVFAGWFEVEAAEAVVDVGPDRRHDPPWATLSRWIRRGWLTSSQPEPDRSLRLRLLRPLASLMRDALDEGSRTEAELRHAAWFSRLQGADALAQIEDVLLAAERATFHGAPELAAACCAALATVGTPEDPRLRAQWQEVRSRWSRVKGHLAQARDLAAEAVRAARATGDDGLLASALYQLGVQHNVRGALGESHLALEEAELAAERAGQPALRARVRRWLATDAMDRGQPEEAWIRLAGAEADLRAAGAQPTDVAEHNVHAGLCALALGRIDEARARLTAADAWYSEAGSRSRRAWTQNNLGEVERSAGHLDEAEAHYRTARALFREAGVDEVVADINLVLCAAARGRIDEAAELVETTHGRAVAQGRSARVAMLELARAVIATPGRPPEARAALDEANRRLVASGFVDRDFALLGDLGASRAAPGELRDGFAALAATHRATTGS